MKENEGKIDLERAEAFESDHFDTYLNTTFPGGRSLCAHFAKAYLESHTQFDWLTGLIKDRPTQSWTVFKAGEIE